MIEVHRGKGMLVPAYGILAALLMNIFTAKVFNDSYYQLHSWPKLVVLWMAGMGCLLTGWYLKKKEPERRRKERDHLASLDPKFDALNKLAYSGPLDHLMFIPVQYWGIVYFAAGIFYAVKSM